MCLHADAMPGWPYVSSTLPLAEEGTVPASFPMPLQSVQQLNRLMYPHFASQAYEYARISLDANRSVRAASHKAMAVLVQTVG